MLFERWFTNKCEALVDDTGEALTGDALLEAMRRGNARRCGELVVIGAKHCKRCGAPAPDSWWNCKVCGRRIGSETRFCSHCGADQDLESRQDLVNGIWSPASNVFAERFELNSYRRAMENGLQIQPGQAAILLNGGIVEGVLHAGHYPLDKLADFQTADETGKSRSLFFVRQGQLDFPLHLQDLMSQEEMPAELKLVAAIQFNDQGAEQFVTNLVGNPAYVKGGTLGVTVTFDSIAHNLLLVKAGQAAKDFCHLHTVDELFLDPQLRLELEKAISNSVEERLVPFGLTIVRIAEMEFYGEIFEQLRKTASGIEITRRELEYQLKADAYIKDHERRSNQADADQEDFLRQLAKEMKVKDAVRDQELALLKERQERERKIAELDTIYIVSKKKITDKAELERLEEEHKQAMLDLRQDRELNRKEREHETTLKLALKDQQHALAVTKIQAEIENIRQEQIHRRTMQIVEEETAAQELKRKILIDTISAFNSADIQTLIMMAPNAATREQLLDLHKIKQQASSRPDDRSPTREDFEKERARMEKIMKDNQLSFEQFIIELMKVVKPQATAPATQIIHN